MLKPMVVIQVFHVQNVIIIPTSYHSHQNASQVDSLGSEVCSPYQGAVLSMQVH